VVPLEGGGRVLVFGLGHASSGIPAAWEATEARPGIRLLDELSSDAAARIGAEIRRYREPGDVVVASIHWGSNWGYDVPGDHVDFAHALVDEGVNLVHGHSSHHVRPVEVYRDGLILYGCGDLLSDYEGISGHESFRGDLSLLYLPTFTRDGGKLGGLRMVPVRTRKMRLERSRGDDARWLARTLSRISRPYGTAVALGDDDVLTASALPPAVTATSHSRSTAT
jgi:poly-gamma-glutamate capsule biosynthesis protein CapA/YwtB (metallophosphatase superfamily)